MEIVLNGTEKIVFSNDLLPENISGGRKSETSYLEEFKIKDGQVKFNSDFRYRLVCYDNIRRMLQGKYLTLMDVFSGFGVTATLFCVKKEFTFLNDIDKNCLSVLKQNFLPENVFQNDLNIPVKSEVLYDLVLGDFNNLTAKKAISEHKTALNTIFSLSKKYVMLNDCTNFFFRYGNISYNVYSDFFGKKIQTPEEFFLVYKEFWEKKFPGWKLRHVEYFHCSSFLLLEKSENDLELTMNKVTDNKKQIITAKL